MSNDHEIIKRALIIATVRRVAQPNVPDYQSVISQLEYLRQVLDGDADGGRLNKIILGVQAAKWFSGDDELADPLHDAAELTRRLLVQHQTQTI